ncbi:MAG: universal stress protein [Thermococcus sp.]
MPDLRKLILRKFNYIAGSRYEEILKEYREFFLSEEEMEIPVISSILVAFDRFSGRPSDEFYDVITSYPGAIIRVVYLIDGGLFEVIQETLGESVAREFQQKETSFGKDFLKEVSKRFSELGLDFTAEIIFGDKASFVEEAMREYDLLVISKHFGSEGLKTYNITPLVFKIIQRVEKPVIVY